MAPDKGDMEALAKVWQDRADFRCKMKTFQENAAILATVAQKVIVEIKQAFYEYRKK